MFVSITFFTLFKLLEEKFKQSWTEVISGRKFLLCSAFVKCLKFKT